MNTRVRPIGLAVIAACGTVLITQFVLPGLRRWRPRDADRAPLRRARRRRIDRTDGDRSRPDLPHEPGRELRAGGARGRGRDLRLQPHHRFQRSVRPRVRHGCRIRCAHRVRLRDVPRRFFDAPRLVVTIVTIGLAALVGGFAVGAIGSLPFWGDGRDLVEAFGGTRGRSLRGLRLHDRRREAAVPFRAPPDPRRARRRRSR